MGPFASFVCDVIFELPYTSVVSYARLWQKRSFHFVRMIRRPHRQRPHIIQYEFPVPGTRVLDSSSSTEFCWYPARTRTKKTVTALESSHRHHRPARATSAHAARGRCFDPKRAATAPGCRACSASREHRVGSLVGQDQTQVRSNSSTRSSSTPDDGSHPPHRPSSIPY